MKRWVGLVAVLALAACQDGISPTTPDEVAPSFDNGVVPGTIPGRFIVTLRDGARPADVASAHSVVPDYVYETVLNGFAGSMSDLARSGLLRDYRVERVEADGIVTTQLGGGVQTSPTWGLDRLDQRTRPLDLAYAYEATGLGVSIYIVDTGIRYTHQDFGGRASLGYDALGGDGSDCHGHGTHVAGTAAGSKYGVAKQARLYSVRVMSCTGSGSWSAVIAGLDWITSKGARPAVANLSIGGSSSASLDDAVRRAVAGGVVVAVAAGNSGVDACTSSPARTAEALTVGASNSSDQKPSWSNFGNCVDLFAPGVSIVSASYGSDTGTATMGGTSMATPHVAGAAALQLELTPNAAPKDVATALLNQTTKGIITSANSVNNNLLHTLGLATVVVPPANSPPTARFSWSCANLSCSFVDSSSDPDGNLTSWNWNFGDGTSSSVRNPNHGFSGPGTFLVRLTAADALGASDLEEQTVSVTVPPPAPIALSVRGYKQKGQRFVELTWSGATSLEVSVFRNNALYRTLPNSGVYTDQLGQGGGSWSYQVCEAGTSVCSAVRAASF